MRDTKNPGSLAAARARKSDRAGVLIGSENSPNYPTISIEIRRAAMLARRCRISEPHARIVAGLAFGEAQR